LQFNSEVQLAKTEEDEPINTGQLHR
jgi:hypothetical protein